MSRARLFALVASSLLAIVGIGCGDCPEGETKHPVSGECVPEIAGNNGTRPDPPDAGTRDAAVVPDAGPRTDAGTIGGDGGITDVGSTDTMTMTGSDGEGEIEAAVMETWVNGAAAAEFRFRGRLQRTSGVTYAVSSQAIRDSEGVMCALNVKRVVSGTPTGLIADRISIVAAPAGNLDLLPRGSGVFTPGANPSRNFFLGAFNESAIIRNKAGDPSSLDELTVMVDNVVLTVVAGPPLSQVLNLSSDTSFSWTRSSDHPNGITLELADRDREVILLCQVTDDGAYLFLAALGTSFKNAGATPPFTLEFLSAFQKVESAKIGGAGNIPVKFRAAWGHRWQAQ